MTLLSCLTNGQTAPLTLSARQTPARNGLQLQEGVTLPGRPPASTRCGSPLQLLETGLLSSGTSSTHVPTHYQPHSTPACAFPDCWKGGRRWDAAKKNSVEISWASELPVTPSRELDIRLRACWLPRERGRLAFWEILPAACLWGDGRRAGPRRAGQEFLGALPNRDSKAAESTWLRVRCPLQGSGEHEGQQRLTWAK